MEQDIPSVELIDEVIAKTQGINPLEALIEDGDFAIGRILIFSAYVGEEQEQLAIATGLNLASIQRISETLRKNGVFGCGVDHCKEYLESETSGLQLSLDMACGKNWLQRLLVEGEVRYKNTEEGIRHVEEDLLRKPGCQESWDKLDKYHGNQPGEWRKRLGKDKKK